MRARSFKQWAENEQTKHLEIEVDVYQTIENTHFIYNFGVILYNVIQKVCPSFHHVYFNFLEIFGQFKYPGTILGQNSFRNKIHDSNPDIIVSTHAHLNHGFFALAKKFSKNKNLKCITYCGELYGGYGFSKHWVNPDADLFIGAVQETCDTAFKLGMAPEKTLNGGFLLNPNFYETHFTEEERAKYIKEELGLDPDQFILILGTGANGANNHMELINELISKNVKTQVIALCSRNEELFDQLTAFSNKNTCLTIKPLGYSNEMGRLLQCASAVVARSGTGLTSEAILSACPIIFNGLGGVMPQENITLKYCRRHNIGIALKRPSSISRIVKALIENPEKLKERKMRKARRRPKLTPFNILTIIKELSEGNNTPKPSISING